MPTFSNKPPSDPRGPSYQIVRTPTGKPLTAIVTSDDLIGTFTHFWKRRTMPCERGNDCQPCQAGIPFRWHAYLSAYLKNHAHVLFECTAQAAENFVAYREAHGSLRGCLFTASRMNYSPNARVIITCKPANLSELTLPNPPDLIAVLAILWDFPTEDLDVTGPIAKRGQQTINTARNRKRGDSNDDPPDKTVGPVPIADVLNPKKPTNPSTKKNP